MRVSPDLRTVVRIALISSAVFLVCLTPMGALAAPSRSPTSTEAIPVGEWNMLANGLVGTLQISLVDDSGNISGVVMGVPMAGFWNSDARRLTFWTKEASNELRVFTGSPLSDPHGRWLLAGRFEAFSGSGATSTRSMFGWDAVPTQLKAPGTVKTSVAFTGLRPLQLAIDANGAKGTLDITGVDALGNVTGTMFGDGIQGFWDGYQRKLTLIRFDDLSSASHLQIYTGYYSTTATASVVAGSFEAFDGVSSQRNVFGWYAVNTNMTISVLPSN